MARRSGFIGSHELIDHDNRVYDVGDREKNSVLRTAETLILQAAGQKGRQVRNVTMWQKIKRDQ